MLRFLAEWSITMYRRHLSPLKGYRCAYGAIHDGTTCSAEVLDIVRHQPLLRWPGAIRRQFRACREAYASIQRDRDRNRRKRSRWTDCCDPTAVCDLPCPSGPCKGGGGFDIDCCP